MLKTKKLFWAFLALLLLATGCMTQKNTDNTLVVYSGRDEKILGPVLSAFTEKTGIQVQPLYGKSAALLTRLQSEGEKSSCDIFLTNDAMTLQRATNQELLSPLPSNLSQNVPEQFRADNNSWLGVTFRVRCFVYNKDLYQPSGTKSFNDFLTPEWEGHVATATSGNSSFIAGLAAMAHVNGAEATKVALEQFKTTTKEQVYPKHTPTVAAVAEGKAKLGYINHYYYHRHMKKNPEAPLGLIFPDHNGAGVPWNLSGVGISRFSENTEHAQKLVEFLVSLEGQALFAQGNYEYPTVSGATLPSQVIPLENLSLSPAGVPEMAAAYDTAIDLIQQVGLD